MSKLRYVCLVALLVYHHALYASQDILVIVNPELPVQSLSPQGIRAIFTMRWNTWEDGTPIKVYVLGDDHDVHARFSKYVIGVFPHQLRKAWDRLVFSGTGQSPIQVSNEEEMIIKISSTRGAIGYITSDKVNENVKQVKIK